MGYCDVLYRKQNIIGYSGNLNNAPTVYFATESRNKNGSLRTKQVKGVNQILFLNGHITQAHSSKNNVGRELAKESFSYSIANVEPDMISGFKQGEISGKRLQETYHSSEVAPDGRSYFPTPDKFSDFHVSRSTFKAVSWKDDATMDKLAKAITQFTYLKPMSGTKPDHYIQKVS